MPVKPSQAKLWYYEDFMSTTQDRQIIPDRAEDWKYLRIWDGNELKPAMPEGFTGIPSDEQIEALYARMLQGELFLFERGNTQPLQLHYARRNTINLDPKAPIEPVKPEFPPLAEPSVPDPIVMENPESLTEEQRADYREQWSVYDREMNTRRSAERSYAVRKLQYDRELAAYDRSVEMLNKFGEGFKSGIASFNANRDLEQERRENTARTQNESNVKSKRNRGRMERVISNMMATRPSALPDMFFSPEREAPTDVRSGHSDAPFKYELFNEKMEPNGYDLPVNSKVDAYDAATINFAMLGAKTYMEQYGLHNMELGAQGGNKLKSTQGFNFLMTGMFGKVRKNQPTAEYLAAAMRAGHEAINNYQDGFPAMLGERLADCVRNIKDGFAGGLQEKVSADMVACTGLVERLLGLFERHPDILEASGLTEKELDFMRGYIEVGKVYDRYLDASMALNDIANLGKEASVDEKAELLADVVIHRMIELEIEKDYNKTQTSPDYLRAMREADEKDAVLEMEYRKWKVENGYNPEINTQAMQAEYTKKHDLKTNALILGDTYPMDHAIIEKLSKPGYLERLRENVLKNPALREMASLPELPIRGTDLDNSATLDALANQLNPLLDISVTTLEEKENWFVATKAMLAQGRLNQGAGAISPWLNSRIASDAERLLIAQDNGEGGKTLVTVASLLENGLADIRDAKPEALDLMYRHAMTGNLYYYDVGKDMPLRLNADGVKASWEVVKEPVQPNAWQRFAHFITGGRAYAALYKPQDRDPAAVEAFLNAREARAEIAANEDANRRQAAARNTETVRLDRTNFNKTQEEMEKAYDSINYFRAVPKNDGAVISFPEYEDHKVEYKLTDIIMHAPDGANGYINLESINIARDMINGLRNPKLTPDAIREMMARAVLLEAVRCEQFGNPKGVVGPIEQNMNDKRKDMIQGMMDNKTFQAFTKDVSLDMFKHFIMVNGARNMNNVITGNSREQANPEQVNEQNVPENVAEKDAAGMAANL